MREIRDLLLDPIKLEIRDLTKETIREASKRNNNRNNRRSIKDPLKREHPNELAQTL